MNKSATPQNAGATKPEGSQEVGAQNLLSSSLLSPVEWRTNEDDPTRTGEASTATDGVATASTDQKARDDYEAWVEGYDEARRMGEL